MITYLPNDPLPSGKYSLSYQSLRDDYVRYSLMSDEEFLGNIVNVLHFACVTCWLKEMNSQHVLSDEGIIHELVHLLPDSTGTSTGLEKIRDLFNRDCCLA